MVLTEKYCFGDIAVEVTYTFDHIALYCRDYITDKAPLFSIAITQEDIRHEALLAKENGDTAAYPDGYLEFLAFLRKFSDLAAERDVILLHGCAVVTDGFAYIFTAPSGTGKTTHARLWLDMLKDKAFILNGDKPLIKISDGQALVYGTPWNGKERLGHNKKYPLKAMCVIEQNENNSISPIDQGEALKVLMSQVYRPYEKEKMQNVLDSVMKLANSVPFYRLKCNISSEAAALSYQELTKERKNEA